MPTTEANHISFAENLEGKILRVRYVENKIGKTQATLIKTVFIIPGATTFTTFTQFSSFTYAILFGITQDPSGNPYLVINLIYLSLGYNFLPFDINTTGTFTPAALQYTV